MGMQYSLIRLSALQTNVPKLFVASLLIFHLFTVFPRIIAVPRLIASLE